MSEKKSYTGGCHCGGVRYTVSDLALNGITCNCSICQKTGTMLAFVPMNQFSLEQGEELLTDYQFSKKRIHHFFCKVCGVRSFARGTTKDGSPVAAVNLRCLDDIEVEKIATQHFNGRAL